MKRKIQLPIRLLIFILALSIPYYIYSQFFTAQKLGINEIAISTGRLHISGNKILDPQNRQFIPRSTQYIRVMDDIPNNDSSPDISLFYKNNYNRAKVETDFKDLKNLGYNSVRLVFNNTLDTGYYNYAWQSDPKLHTCKEGTNKPLSECIDITGVDNLVHALQTAKANNIKVILSFIGMNPTAYQTEINKLNNFLYTQAAHDYGRYLKSLFSYLKDKNVLDSILAVQPEAEPFLYTNKSAVPLKTGDYINSTNGYNVSQNHRVDDTFFSNKSQWLGHSSPTVKALLNDAIPNSFNYWFDAIKSVDPELLTLYDQFPATNLKTWLDWHADDMTIVNPALKADILAMQLYPNNINSDEKISTKLDFNPGFKEAMTSKPFIMVEYGLNKNTSPVEQRIPYITNWLKESCSYGIAGWSYFNYNEDNFTFVTLTQDNFGLARALSPKHFANPCTSKLDQLPLISPDSATVHLVDQSKKYGFPDSATFNHFGYKQGDQIKVTTEYLNKYTTINNIGRYVRGSSETAYLMENGKRRQIPNWDTFISISPPGSKITQLSDEYIDNLPLGSPVPSSMQGAIPSPGDLNGDGNVDVFDFNELVSGYGTKYTIFDFNNIVANYGK